MDSATIRRTRRLRELMREHALTCAEVAGILRANHSHIRAMHAGLKPITWRNLRLLELELQVRGHSGGQR